MFGESFWAFLQMLLVNYGMLALVELTQIFLVVYLFRLIKSIDEEKKQLVDKLLECCKKRLEDAKEERDEYEDLAKNLDASIDLLIKTFR